MKNSDEKKTKVQVKITFRDFKTYKANAEMLKKTAADAGGTMAVKMV